MNVETTRFGVLNITEEDLLVVPTGLFGFEEITHYVLIDHRADSPLRWLQAVGRPELAFVVIDPLVFHPEYRAQVSEEDRRSLDCSAADPVDVLVIVGIPEDPTEMTANLKGPLLINWEKRLARQSIQCGEEYPARLRIFDAIRKRACAPGRRGDSC